MKNKKLVEEIVQYFHSEKFEKTEKWDVVGEHIDEIIESNRLETLVMPKIEEVTRVVVVDHRSKIADGVISYGRTIDAWNVSTSLDLQDENRTLKIFINDR